MTDGIDITAIRAALEQAEGRLGLGAGQVEGVRRLIKELRAELDKLEQEPKPWPQVGDEYWCTAAWIKIGVFDATWCDDEVDRWRLASGDCFRTKAEALAYREWQTDPRVVARGMIERMEGFDPRGEDYINVDPDGDLVVTVEFANYDGGLRFRPGFAGDAIDKLGEDLIKVALGVITDKEEGSRIVREAISRGA